MPYPWVQPLVLTVLLAGGLSLRRWGTGRAPAFGMAVLWIGVAVAVGWFAWSLRQMLALIEPG